MGSKEEDPVARGSAGRVVLNARSQKNRVPPGPGRERGAEGGLRGAGPSGAACGRKYCAVTGWRPRGCSRLPKLTILHFKLANVLACRLDSVTLRKTQAHSSRGSWSESEWERENTRATPGPVRRSQPGHSAGGRAARGRAAGQRRRDLVPPAREGTRARPPPAPACPLPARAPLASTLRFPVSSSPHLLRTAHGSPHGVPCPSGATQSVAAPGEQHPPSEAPAGGSWHCTLAPDSSVQRRATHPGRSVWR